MTPNNPLTRAAALDLTTYGLRIGPLQRRRHTCALARRVMTSLGMSTPLGHDIQRVERRRRRPTPLATRCAMMATALLTLLAGLGCDRAAKGSSQDQAQLPALRLAHAPSADPLDPQEEALVPWRLIARSASLSLQRSSPRPQSDAPTPWLSPSPIPLAQLDATLSELPGQAQALLYAEADLPWATLVQLVGALERAHGPARVVVATQDPARRASWLAQGAPPRCVEDPTHDPPLWAAPCELCAQALTPQEPRCLRLEARVAPGRATLSALELRVPWDASSPRCPRQGFAPPPWACAELALDDPGAAQAIHELLARWASEHDLCPEAILDLRPTLTVEAASPLIEALRRAGVTGAAQARAETSLTAPSCP